MRIGKLSNEELEKLVLAHLPKPAAGDAVGPGVGLDCAVMAMGGGRSLVLSADPITAADSDAGRIAVHISCNDVATAGIRPAGLLTVVILPPTVIPEDIEALTRQIAETARSLGVAVVGGHTEISSTVQKPLIVTTAFGWTDQPVILASGGQPGDALVMSKTAALEGTSILAGDRVQDLAGILTETERAEAQALVDQISVVPEGEIGAAEQVHAMHDVTEGGVLGACWELSQASGTGCRVEIGKIPMHPLTRRITDALGLDPLRLMSSGTMLMATDRPDDLIRALGHAGIQATCIGSLVDGPCVIGLPDGSRQILAPPEADELYKRTDSSYY